MAPAGMVICGAGPNLNLELASSKCQTRGLLTDRQARKVDALKHGSDAFAEMRRLAMRFHGILRGKKSAPLDAWIDEAEGQINRLKTLKRAMYGRAGPELLRARMFPPRYAK